MGRVIKTKSGDWDYNYKFTNLGTAHQSVVKTGTQPIKSRLNFLNLAGLKGERTSQESCLLESADRSKIRSLTGIQRQWRWWL
jgi:hypothetical protein